MVFLGVNIDHIATLRQQRRGQFPPPIEAARLAEESGADGIVAHLREDRRHIQDSDIRELRQKLKTRLSMEMGATPEMQAIALEVRPQRVCLVPEKRQELTTEGGLDILKHRAHLEKFIPPFQAKKIEVSLFIDPDLKQVQCAKDLGAECVELHTGSYAEAAMGSAQDQEFSKLLKASELAVTLGLHLHAGHGLDYTNVQRVARIPGMEELNIGFSIISRAVFTGLGMAVREMKALL